jgi:hypothetical protein
MEPWPQAQHVVRCGRIPSPMATHGRRYPRGQPAPGWALGGLIFGLIRLCSSTFVSVRINTAMQVTDVNGIRRTIIQTSENRKVDSFGRARAAADGSEGGAHGGWMGAALLGTRRRPDGYTRATEPISQSRSGSTQGLPLGVVVETAPRPWDCFTNYAAATAALPELVRHSCLTLRWPCGTGRLPQRPDWSRGTSAQIWTVASWPPRFSPE